MTILARFRAMSLSTIRDGALMMASKVTFVFIYVIFNMASLKKDFFLIYPPHMPKHQPHVIFDHGDHNNNYGKRTYRKDYLFHLSMGYIHFNNYHCKAKKSSL